MHRELPHYFIACISKLEAYSLLTAGLTMPSTMRIKLHINKTPLTNNRAPKLRSILHKTPFKFSGGRETLTKATYRKGENLGENNMKAYLVHANLTHKFDLYPSLKRR